MYSKQILFKYYALILQFQYLQTPSRFSVKLPYFTRSAQSYESRFSQRESYSTDVVYFELLGDLSRMTESTHNMAMENNATT